MKKIAKRSVRRGGSRGLWFLAPSLLGVGYLVLLPTGDVLRRSCLLYTSDAADEILGV